MGKDAIDLIKKIVTQRENRFTGQDNDDFKIKDNMDIPPYYRQLSKEDLEKYGDNLKESGGDGSGDPSTPDLFMERDYGDDHGKGDGPSGGSAPKLINPGYEAAMAEYRENHQDKYKPGRRARRSPKGLGQDVKGEPDRLPGIDKDIEGESGSYPEM
ncbi:MAG: hypothetical protein IJA61_04095 [Clostridia bacterium]|nr:hypothetical protein [Clostridia bacterium]